LWNPGTLQPFIWSGWAPALHKTRLLCTNLFCLLVGDVENKGLYMQLRCWISRTPEFHSIDLENWTACQVAAP